MVESPPMRRTPMGPPPARPARDDAARSTGIFLMALWSAAMVLLTWDMVSSSDDSCGPAGCPWTGLAGVHAAMQVALFLAALGAGSAGAGIWFGAEPGRPARPA